MGSGNRFDVLSSSSSAFGSGTTFGSGTKFGGGTGTSVFGGGASSGGATVFGSGTSAFGSNSAFGGGTSAFGGSNSNALDSGKGTAFGVKTSTNNTSTSAFGGTSSAFGSGGAFGSGAASSAFGGAAGNSSSAFSGGGRSAFGGGGSAFGGIAKESTAVPQKTAFGTSASSAFGSFSAASPKTKKDGSKEVTLTADFLERGIKDRPLWKYSTFGPMADKPNLLTGTDISPEEARLDFVVATQQQSPEALNMCEQKYEQLAIEMNQKINDIVSRSQHYAQQWEQQYGVGNSGSAFGSSSAFGGSSFASRPAVVISFGTTPEEVSSATGPSRDLTPDEIASFQALSFALGAIPEVPPTIELR
ncbi:hypothetical protein GGI20_003048 [Coemansia sp. BCRC 34301]|nr:hypothetical protein GGI20_003048 [Coemansia sp. BCRC 34301]